MSNNAFGLRWTAEDVEAARNRLRATRPGSRVPRATLPSPGRPTKYGNRRCVYDGLKFGSRDELARWKDLQLMQKAGAIAGLQHQPKFELRVNGQLVCRYEADSSYALEGHVVVEDVKSEATRKNRAYRIKVKLMKACHGIEIAEFQEGST